MKVSETRSSDFEYISFLECNDLLSKTQLQREGGGLQWANLCKKKKKKKAWSTKDLRTNLSNSNSAEHSGAAELTCAITTFVGVAGTKAAGKIYGRVTSRKTFQTAGLNVLSLLPRSPSESQLVMSCRAVDRDALPSPEPPRPPTP